MRRNAITRIIVWSIVIILLVGIQFGVIFGVNHQRIEITESALAVTIPYETEVALTEWRESEKNTFSASEVREIEIEWVSGDILIMPHNTDTIIVREDGSFDAKYAMIMSCREGELNIKFCADSVSGFVGINSTNNLSKDLTIYVPQDWVCESLELDVASSKVEVNDLTIREVEFDAASGTCEFENCIVGEMDIDTASGDVRFIGELNILDCDAVSASVYAVLGNTPSRLDLESMAGDLDITLPADAGFTLSMSALSRDFSSDFDTTMKNGNHVSGDGRCRINVDGMSGDVVIRKAAAVTVPVVTTEPDVTTAP